MILFEEAKKLIERENRILPVEKVPLHEAYRRVIAEDLYAVQPNPPFDNSAIDGFAVRSRDIDRLWDEEKGYALLEKSGVIFAGDKPDEAGIKVEDGKAVKIFTGAPIPYGADSVVMVEWTEERERVVAIRKRVKVGDNIRKMGEDIEGGQLLLRGGTTLLIADVGLIAMMGIPYIGVYSRPRVHFFCTGNEVLLPGERWEEGKVYSANSFTLRGMIEEAGGLPKDLGIVRDNEDSLFRIFDMALSERPDILISSGGVSMGESDLIKKVFERLGRTIFWKVAIKPGKPILFGKAENTLFFGLPGNPVSTMVTFEVFVRPAIRRMMGDRVVKRAEVKASSDLPLKKIKGLRYFFRGVLREEGGRFFVRLTGPQGSGILSSMAKANGLIVLSEDVEEVKEGEMVDFIMTGSI